MFHKTPALLQKVYPRLLWSMPREEKIIYLTFDDGPIPTLTSFILNTLKEFNAKGTFFCVGENIAKYADILLKAKADGHQIGNHTFNHLNGWKTKTGEYLNNIKKCQQELDRLGMASDLFRPPYGKITFKQINEVLPHYKVVMWDVLTKDYDQNLDREVCLKRSIQYTKPGSIVVFHDNLKAEKSLTYTLPRYLDHFISLGYQFNAL